MQYQKPKIRAHQSSATPMRRQRRAAIGLLGVCLVALAGVLGAPPTRVIVVGGSSGMGKALAKAIVARGGSVLLISRSMEKLISAQVCVCVCHSWRSLRPN